MYNLIYFFNLAAVSQQEFLNLQRFLEILWVVQIKADSKLKYHQGCHRSGNGQRQEILQGQEKVMGNSILIQGKLK